MSYQVSALVLYYACALDSINDQCLGSCTAFASKHTMFYVVLYCACALDSINMLVVLYNLKYVLWRPHKTVTVTCEICCQPFVPDDLKEGQTPTCWQPG